MNSRLHAKQDHHVAGALGDESPFPARSTSSPSILPPAGARVRPVTTNLSTVTPATLRWLWPGRFLFGKVNMLCGDPGLGKSMLALHVASHVSTGSSFPDSPDIATPQGNVVLLLGEDDLATTVRPRIEATGGNLQSIEVLTGVERGNTSALFDLRLHLGALEDAVERVAARLVIIDPISAFLGRTDTNRDADVRRVLSPLSHMAERHGVAVLCVMHLGKDASRRAIYRANGSVAFAAAPRAVWAVGKDPADPDRRIVACVKMNVAKPAPGIAFRINGHGLVWDSEPVEVDADQLLGRQPAPQGGIACRDAESAIIEALQDEPLFATELEAQVSRRGVARRTFQRARANLRAAGMIQCSKTGYGGNSPFAYSLASHSPPSSPVSESGEQCEQ